MTKKRLLSILLTIAMMFQAMPMNVFAAGTLRSNTLSGGDYHDVAFYLADADANGNPNWTGDTVSHKLITTQLVENGANAVMPDVPEVNGYTFTGWSPDPAAAITANTSFYAQYTPIVKYTVAVNYVFTDGSQAAPSLSYDIVLGDASAENDITVTPHEQAGFSMSITDENGNAVSLSGGSFTVDVSELTGDKTYTVLYTGKEAKYTVNHHKQNLKGEYDIVPEVKNGMAGELTAAAANTYEGYTVVDFNAVSAQKNINPNGTTVIDIYYDLNTYSLTYDTQGGTYLDSSILPYSAPVSVPAVTRAGYTFAGWTVTTDPAGLLGATMNANASFTMPAGNVTLKANWTAQETATYTVVFWKQSLYDKYTYTDAQKTYDFVSKATYTGAVGADADALRFNYQNAYGYYFTINAAKTNPELDKTVSADGSTIYNIYYDRKTITMNFYRKGNTDGNPSVTIIGLYGQSHTQAGTTWPTPNNGYLWKSNEIGNSAGITYLDGFIPNGQTTEVNVWHVSFGNKPVDYLTQNLDGTYSVAHTFPSLQNGVQADEDKFVGFTLYQYRENRDYSSDNSKDGWTDWKNVSDGTSIGSNKTNGDKKDQYTVTRIEVRYTRNSYKLYYDNCAGMNPTSYLYMQPWEEPAIPSVPSNVDSDYIFDCWCTDITLQNEVVWEDMVQPAADAIVYARWKAPERKVVYHLNYDGAADPYASYTVLKYETLGKNSVAQGGAYTLPASPVREGYNFGGWYTDAACTMPLVNGFADTTIAKDWDIYAKWEAAGKLTATGSVVTTAQIEIEGYFEDGVWVEITPDMLPTAQGVVGETVTIKALDIPGYVPVQYNIEYTIVEGTNIVKIEYIKLDTWHITVNYVDTNGNTIAASDTLSNLTETTKAVNYKVIPGGTENGKEYIWQADTHVQIADIEDAVEDENGELYAELTFTYKKVFQVNYTVEHWVETLNGSYVKKETDAKVGWTGFTANVGSADAKNYASENLEYDPANDNNVLTATIVEGAVLKMYYKLMVADYTINHYLNGTTTKVADSETGTMNIGDTLTAGAASALYSEFAAATVSAYNPSQKITIDAEAANNVINVYYKLPLTITAGTSSKIYDGSALTNAEFTAEGLVNGDTKDELGIVMTAASTITNVGSVANDIDESKATIPSYYNVTYVNGTLTVTKKTVTITADSDTKVYDATALIKNSYTNTALAAGDKIASVTVTGSQTVVGTSNNVPSAAKIVNAKGEDVTASYEITYANGTLEVTKKAITITADSDTKVYDATALTKDSYTNTDLAAGDKIASVTVTGSQTVVGTSNNVPSAAKIVNAKGEDVTASYEITYANGTLTVTKKTVTITADSDTKVYDATALTKNSYTNTDLAAGDKIASVTVTGSQTVVGTSDNVPSAAKIVNAKGEDVTASYEITYANGTLTVTKKTVTITADSDTKVYDAAALTKNSYTNTALAAGDKIASVTVTGSQTVVGTSNNVPSAAKIVNAKGEDVTASYEINYANGTLEVTKKAITITADSDTKVYDAAALTKDSYTNTDLAEGDKIASVTVTGSQTVVGTSDNVPSAAKIVNAKGEDVTASYEINYANGTLTVTKKAVTITADSDTKVYDATALTKNSYTNTALAAGDKIESVTVTGSQTVVGTSDNVPSAAKIVNAKGEDVTASYEITYANGTLTVTKKAVTITADSDTKVYDATALTKNSYTNTDLAAGDKIASVTVTGSQIVVGTSDNVPSAAKIVNAQGEDVTASYEITYANGTLEVTKKTVTITADSDTKVYDATALTKNSYTNTDLAAGDKIDTVTVTGTQTVVGTSDNVPSAAKIVNAKGEDVTASYEITYANGTLEVTKKTVTITADSDTKVYDAAALTKNSYTNTDLAAGDKIDSVTVTGSQTVVGTSDNVPSAAKIVNAKGEDVTASYDITYANGTLEVTKKTVTITADSDTKVYDATALTNDGYTADGLAEGDNAASVTVSGSQIVVGTSNNVPSEAIIKNASGVDVTASYDITYVNGTLEVTPLAVSIKAESGNKVYDGTALIVNAFIDTGLAEGDTIESVTVTGSQTDVGTSDNVPSAAKIVNANGEDVTASYDITYLNGTLIVIKRSVTLTSATDAKVYDGTALTNNTVTVSGDGFATGEGASYTVTGTQTEVGSSANAFTYTLNAGTKAENYTITTVEGTLTVTELTDKVTVTITEHSDEVDYDGEEHTVKGYDVSINNALYTVADFTFGGNDSVSGINAGAYDMQLKPEDFTNTNTNFADVTFVIVDGQLVINPIDVTVTITEHSDEADYDGEEHTVTGYDVEISDELYTEADFTFSGNDSVSGINAGAYDMQLKPEDFTNTNTNFANVTFVIVDGQLVINPIDVTVTITEHSDEVDYDGKEHTVTGYDVEIGNELYTEADFTFSGNDSVSGTDAGTYDMELKPEDFANTNDNFATVTFVIVDGQLVINPIDVTVTITEHSGEVVYDSEEHTVSGYDVEISDELYTEADFTFSGNDSVSGKNVGTYDMELKPEDFANTNSNFANVTFVIVDGQLVIEQMPITITADSAQKQYDGTALTKDSYTATALANGDAFASVNVTGTITEVGTVDNVPSAAKIMDGEEDVTANYDITYVNGKLEITKTGTELKVVANSNSWEYDSEYHADGGYTVTYGDETYTVAAGESATLKNGDTVTATITAQVKNVADTAADNNVIVTLVVEHEDQYETITKVPGTLTITEKPVTITADSASKEYDGTELVKDSYTSTDLATGDAYESVTVTGTITEVGSVDNVPSAAKIVDGEEDVTANYDITYVNGKLEITQSTKELKVVANSNSWEYDSENHADGGYTVTYGDETYTVAAGESATLSTGDKVTATITKQVKNVADTAEGNNEIVTLVIENEDQYANIVTEAGTLTITQKPVTITADSASKEYDGTELVKDSYTSTDLAEGDAYESVTVTGTITEVGSVDNVPSAAKIVDGEEDVTANYDITYVNGKLEITQSTKELKVVANSNSWEYDSEYHADGGYTVTYGDETYTVAAGESATLSTGDKVTATITKQVKNVADTAEGNNEIVTLVIENEDQYANIVTEAGTLTITQKPVTITADSASKEYDGTELTKDSYTSTDLATGDAYESVTVTGTITEVGSVDNVPSAAKIMDGEEDVTANYDITYVNGKLEITQSTKELKVVANSNSWEYDSEYHADGGYTVTYGDETYTVAAGESATLSTGDKVMATITKQVKNVADTAEGNNEIVTLVIDNEEQYENVVTEAGTLTITQKPVTITADSASKEYDGTALTKDSYTSTDLAAGDSFDSVTITGSIVYVGSVPNVASDAKIVDGEEDVTANYDITYVNGTLEITQSTKELKVVANSNSWEYDSEYHADGGYTVTYGDETYTVAAGESATLSTGDKVTATITKQVKNVADTAEGNNEIVTLIIENEDQYANVVTEAGTLTITQKPVTITADSASKEYDGTELTKDSYTSTDLAAGDSFDSVTITGSIIYVGSVPNVASDAKIVDGEEDVTANYVITYVDGTLTIEEPSDHSLAITKTHEDKEYAVNETVEFTITVKNIFIDARTITISEIDGVTITGESVFENVEPGEIVTTTAEYVITDEDLIAGEFVNTATATYTGSETKYTAVDTVVTVEATAELSITKETTSTPENSEGYALDETIEYKIVVTNSGNLTVHEIVVTDELTGLTYEVGTLYSGESSDEITTSYTVTSDDILNGSVINVAVANGTAADDTALTVEAEVEDETADVDATLTVVKESDVEEGDTVSLGDTINYTIIVTNEGNVPFYNVVVTDEWTGDEWTIVELAVVASETFTTSYVVKESDIIRGYVLNEVTAIGDPIDDPKNPDVPKTPEDDDDVEDPTDEANPVLTIEKVLTNLPEKGYFTVDEVATFEITVKNEGNLTITDVQITEELEGALFTEGEGYEIIDNVAVIAEMLPGDEVVVNAEYTILIDDLSTEVVNIVTATGKGPNDPENPDRDLDPEDDDDDELVPVDEITEVPVTKIWKDLENKWNTRPEGITIRLYDDGEEIREAVADASTEWMVVFDKLPMHNVDGTEVVYTVSEDEVIGYNTEYAQDEWNITNSLEEYKLTVRYWFYEIDGDQALPTYEKDVLYGEIYSVHTPSVKGHAADIIDVEGVITEDAVWDVIFTRNEYYLRINYVYEDGSQAAPKYVEKYLYEDPFWVYSPIIEGYTTNRKVVEGTMPAYPLEFTVIYVPEQKDIVIEEYGVPLGIGNVEMNIGECFE